ncbi:DUF1684 domain-containing protein [Algoriphagus jejuensis]|uniref:DUF1684 domain-containing protein n=1 Tax=Algoriphagus jejuensis TaxID=419934 RepID=A0ABP3Y9D3_9BACT
MPSYLLQISLMVLLVKSTTVIAQNPDFEQWKRERNAEIVAEDGWLNLAGLLWLESGDTHLIPIGKDSLALAQKASKKELGKFQVGNDTVLFIAAKRKKVFAEGRQVAELLQYPLEKNGQYIYLNSGRWKWSVIKRGDRYGARIRDLQHPALENFEPIPTYDYDSNWKFKAFFEPRFNEFINITNVLGQVIEWRVMGILTFEIDGKRQSLITLEDLGKLFVIFSDETNGKETYPSGRYLYVDFPDKSGNTTIDFNFAYNPPCAFTAFATCPIPPKENRLDFEIEVGERMPEGH